MAPRLSPSKRKQPEAPAAAARPPAARSSQLKLGMHVTKVRRCAGLAAAGSGSGGARPHGLAFLNWQTLPQVSRLLEILLMTLCRPVVLRIAARNSSPRWHPPSTPAVAWPACRQLHTLPARPAAPQLHRCPLSSLPSRLSSPRLLPANLLTSPPNPRLLLPSLLASLRREGREPGPSQQAGARQPLRPAARQQRGGECT